MAPTDLNQFDILSTLSETPECTRQLARLENHDPPVQLITFSDELSDCPEFRRVLKTDRDMLEMLRHQSVVHLLGVSESANGLFCWTEQLAAPPLRTRLESDQQFSVDDVIEVGWQICSALQQAHNLGVVHGFLSIDTILVSDSLSVWISDFGIARWLHVAATSKDQQSSETAERSESLMTVSVMASQSAVEQDLSDLARILADMLRQADSQESTAAAEQSLRRLLDSMLDPDQPRIPVTAREFQGRLGELLLGSGQPEIPIVDERNSPGVGKRSIIVELFDPMDSDAGTASGNSSISAETASRQHKLPILVIAAAAVLITIVAALLF